MTQGAYDAEGAIKSDNFQEHGNGMTNTDPIKTEALYRHCDPALVDFATSDQAAEVAGLFGQRRVVDALDFGVAMSRPGYNLFVISDPEGELGDESSRQGIALLRTEGGFVFSPLKGDEPMPPDDFAQLSDGEKERFARAMNEFGERMQKLSYQFPRWRRDMQASLRQLGRETVHLAVGHLIDELKERHAAQPKVLAFLDRVLADVIEYGEALRDKRGGGEGLELAGEGRIDRRSGRHHSRRQRQTFDVAPRVLARLGQGAGPARREGASMKADSWRRPGCVAKGICRHRWQAP